MNRREELQQILEDILGSRNVYYQPPANVRMNYPAIVYERTDIENVHANNAVYRQTTCYKVVVIDKNPNSQIVYAVSKLPKCRHTGHFTSDNLNHDSFKLYY